MDKESKDMGLSGSGIRIVDHDGDKLWIIVGRYAYLVDKRYKTDRLFVGSMIGDCDCGPGELEAAAHFKFQRLIHTPEGMRTIDDKLTWAHFLRFFDLETYNRNNAEPENWHGEVTRIRTWDVKIKWSDGRCAVYELCDLPGVIATFEAGAKIIAQVKRNREGKLEWWDVKPWIRDDFSMSGL